MLSHSVTKTELKLWIVLCQSSTFLGLQACTTRAPFCLSLPYTLNLAVSYNVYLADRFMNLNPLASTRLCPPEEGSLRKQLAGSCYPHFLWYFGLLGNILHCMCGVTLSSADAPQTVPPESGLYPNLPYPPLSPGGWGGHLLCIYKYLLN